MLTAITTTHAVPQHLPSVRTSVRPTLIVCRYCLQTLGSSPDPVERKSIEASHKCGEKLQAKQPAASIPFS
ncbi:MAG TPA: hypothetical protein VHT28_12965 [Silvibacterium sp.]|jgi:hypothetical protein|nr:hypothetical protein [Silvibacterium sp.]